MEPEALYRQLGALMADPPNLRSITDTFETPPITLKWLGRISAIVEQSGNFAAASELNIATQGLLRTQGGSTYSSQIWLCLNKELARLELKVPASASGTFVASGSAYDAAAAISRVLSLAKLRVLIVDAYMSETVLSDFAVLVPERVEVALLTDSASVKPGLEPMAARWITQHGDARPLSVRLASPKSLHDRLIFLDDTDAWILTQSLKDFANRSPATIQRTDPDLAKLKLEAYSSLWNASAPLA